VGTSAKHTGKYQKILKYPRFDDDLAAALEDVGDQSILVIAVLCFLTERNVQRVTQHSRTPGSLPVTPGSLPVTGARVAHLVQYLADQSRELGLERVRTLTLPLGQDLPYEVVDVRYG
jgi:hypothetical protein